MTTSTNASQPECIQCGYCCTVAPCPYGDWDKEKHQCRHLTKDNCCARYNEVVKLPGAWMSPAFGAGCSSSLFNDRRKQRMKELENPA